MTQPMTDIPSWFTDALAQPPKDGWVDVLGANIHYLHWGDPADPGILLIHGGAAHAHWWSHLAPMLARSNYVVALDLSGHGDSDRRGDYPPEHWMAEVMAVAEHSGMGPRPVVVGHSMGGFVAILTASVHGQSLAGAVIVDAPVRRPDPETEEATQGRSFGPPKVYADREFALGRFRFIPPQPVTLPFVFDHIAATSLREVEGGWTWKFDPNIFGGLRRRLDSYLAGTKCRVAVFHGEYSDLVTPDVSDYMSELLGRTAPFVEIPQSYHHLILDQPLAFIAALRAILADWEHTVPRKPPGLEPPGLD